MESLVMTLLKLTHAERTDIQNQLEDLFEKENKLIKALDKEHQIVDCDRLLTVLYQRSALKKILDNSI